MLGSLILGTLVISCCRLRPKDKHPLFNLDFNLLELGGSAMDQEEVPNLVDRPS